MSMVCNENYLYFRIVIPNFYKLKENVKFQYL